MAQLNFEKHQHNIFFIAETPSTMTEILSLVHQDCPHGTCLYTDLQTKGRGRLKGREWNSQRGENLLFTQFLKESLIEVPTGLIPLWTALTLTRLIHTETGQKAMIKWPNDVLIEDKKIAGILCQKRENSFLLGVGLNVNQTQWGNLENPPTSLRLMDGKKRDILDLLQAFVRTQGDCQFFSMEEYHNNMWGLNQQVSFYPGIQNKPHKGIIRGVSGEGALLLETHAGLKEYYSGEISFHQ